jgi:pimeloyl-ACP methyl ester carboxylesterase
MQAMNIDGQSLEVRLIEGSAALAPLVFLHEGLGCVSLWTQRGLDWPLAVCQATGRKGVVYSRRGYGQSDPAPTGRKLLPPNYMHTEALEVLPGLLDALGIQRPALLGHSDGATIALLYASRLPSTACIAMAPHVMVEPVAITSIAVAKIAFESGDLRQRLARHHHNVDGAFWQWNDVWLSAGFADFDIRRECSWITTPLLLIQGEDDEYGTMAQLDDISMAAPHALQVRLANCGHSPHRDQPEQSLKAVVNLLKSLD